MLASLQHLDHLRIGLALLCLMDASGEHVNATDGGILFSLLEPLKAVRARDFVVRVEDPVRSVRARLGAIPYRLERGAISG